MKQLRNLLNAWHDLFPNAVTLRRVAEEARRYTKDDAALATKRAALLEALQTVALDHREINLRRLGNWIARHKGRIVDGLHFEEAGSSQRAVLWIVGKEPEGESHA